jgi:hypothetical protein
MRKVSLLNLLFASVVLATGLQSCKDDSYLLQAPAVPNQSFRTGADSMSALLSAGWKIQNASYPLGGNVWQNGGDAVAPIFSAFSQSGSNSGFIGTTINCVRTPVAADAAPFALISPYNTAPVGVANNWLFSKEIMMQNGDEITFYTRAQILVNGTGGDSTDWGNRLQVRINQYGTDLNIGTVKPLWQWLYTNTPDQYDDNVGNYDIVLLDINPNMNEWHAVVPGTSVVDGRPYNATTNLQAYPKTWTKFTAKVSGLSQPTKSRFAFRYYVPGGDPNNGLATGIGIDEISYKSVGY